MEPTDLKGARRAASVRGEFRVHNQPLVGSEQSEVVGFDALLRWEHPRRGVLGRHNFLRTAEESGLIVAIGT